MRSIPNALSAPEKAEEFSIEANEKSDLLTFR
ncbi:hypothetical protein RHECNPAF_12210032 [Rhizobium etli CNPAF512]|nr:hypothetical protein RHECNPAF_12210032 [Rhizobium etli CNPAF512]